VLGLGFFGMRHWLLNWRDWAAPPAIPLGAACELAETVAGICWSRRELLVE
jgi:hypothetical protein